MHFYVNVSIIETYKSHRALLMYRQGVFDFNESLLSFSLDNTKQENRVNIESLIKLLEIHVETMFQPESQEQ